MNATSCPTWPTTNRPGSSRRTSKGFGTAGRFLDQLRRVAARKPVLLLKAGRGRAGAELAASHTAGPGRVA